MKLSAIPTCVHNLGVSHFRDECIKVEKVVKITRQGATNDKVRISKYKNFTSKSLLFAWLNK